MKLRILLTSALMLISCYGDIIFAGRSFSLAELENVPGAELKAHKWLPDRHGRSPRDLLFDPGGATLQSEPEQMFIKRWIWNGESILWNPYSGLGTKGLESMVDIKFSPRTILTGLLGGSSIAFHISALLLMLYGVFFLNLFLESSLGFSRWTSLVTCYFYLLQGYSVANLNSNFTQVWYFAPAILFFADRLIRNHSTRDFALTAIHVALMFLITFMPTTTLSIIAVFAFCTALIFERANTSKLRSFLLLTGSFSLGLALVSALYLPMTLGVLTNGELESYSARTFYPSHLKGLLALFTSRNFHESYGFVHHMYAALTGNVIFHFGIVAFLFVLVGIGSKKFRWLKLIAVALSIAFLARIFGLPVYSDLFSILPVIGKTGCQYLWVVPALSSVLLFAFGFESWVNGNRPKALSGALILLVFAGVILALQNLNINFDDPPNHYKGYLTAGVLALISVVYLALSKQRSRNVLLFASIAVVGELLFNMSTCRYDRTDIFAQPTEYVEFIKQNLTPGPLSERIANFGSHGIPADFGTAYGIAQIEAMTMSLPKTYYNLCKNRIMPTRDRYTNFCAVTTENDEPIVTDELMDELSVKYVLVSKYMAKHLALASRIWQKVYETSHVAVFENSGFKPRLYSQDNGVTIDLRNVQNNRLEIQAINSASNPALLVFTNNFDPDWRATIDDKKTEIQLSGDTFMSVEVPPGAHIVKFCYWPRGLTAGLIISAITGLFLVALLIRNKKLLQ